MTDLCSFESDSEESRISRSSMFMSDRIQMFCQDFYVIRNPDFYVIIGYVTDLCVRQNPDAYKCHQCLCQRDSICLNVIDVYVSDVDVINIFVRRNPDACGINVYIKWNAVQC